jgi:hypothetical protein
MAAAAGVAGGAVNAAAVATDEAEEAAGARAGDE